MSTDYSKRKNAELEDLLKARSLPHTGKKADLVARLQQYDKEHSSTSTPTAATTTTAPEDEIDWEDDTVPSTTTAAAAASAPTTTTKGATSSSSAAALAAGGKGPVDNPVAIPNQVPAEDPSSTSDLTVKPPSATDDTTTDTTTTTTTAAPSTSVADAKPAPDFSSHLPTTSLPTELEKRQKRAARFGLLANASNSNEDAVKALERAKRFGTSAAGEGDEGAVKGLDTALPERGARKRGRGGEDGGDGGEKEGVSRGGKRGRRDGVRARGARSAGRGGERRNGGAGGDRVEGKGGERRNGGGEGKGGRNGGGGGGKGASGGLSEKDRVAAEARKKRFAAAATSAS